MKADDLHILGFNLSGNDLDGLRASAFSQDVCEE
jgi:hypothetical protein